MEDSHYYKSAEIAAILSFISTIFSEMNVGLLIYQLEDADRPETLRLVYANPQASKCTQTDLTPMIGKYIGEAFPGLAETEIPATYAEVIRSKTSRNVGVVEYQDENIDHSFFEVKAFPLPQDCAGILFTNITGRKQMEEMIKRYNQKLREKNNELEKFVSIASHDLRSPLQQIQLTAADLISRTFGLLPESDHHCLRRIVESTRRMSRLIDNLLAYSRAGKSAVKMEPVDLSEVVEHVLSDLQYRIVEANATVQVGKLGMVPAVPIEMHQLFLNLIGNALKYRRENVPPVIQVSGKKSGEQYHIRIKDNGIGFDPRDGDKIFQPFQRLFEKEDRYEGSGIGLATCRKIVERHGGTITATGRPGQGATFTISLPLTQKT